MTTSSPLIQLKSDNSVSEFGDLISMSPLSLDSTQLIQMTMGKLTLTGFTTDYNILWAIILPFNRTMITVEVVSKVVCDIIGSCLRSVSLLCEVFKGIIKYFGPIIHDTSMNFIMWQCKDILGYSSCLNYCSDIVRI